MDLSVTECITTLHPEITVIRGSRFEYGEQVMGRRIFLSDDGLTQTERLRLLNSRQMQGSDLRRRYLERVASEIDTDVMLGMGEHAAARVPRNFLQRFWRWMFPEYRYTTGSGASTSVRLGRSPAWYWASGIARVTLEYQDNGSNTLVLRLETRDRESLARALAKHVRRVHEQLGDHTLILL